MNRHLTDDELIDQIYGAAVPDRLLVEHVAACPECGGKLARFEQRRAAALGRPLPLLHESGLRAQRASILERIEHRPAFRLHWFPAVLAGGLLAAVALTPQFSRSPIAPAAAGQQEIAGDQIFREVLTLERAEEPRAASPIRALFEEAAN